MELEAQIEPKHKKFRWTTLLFGGLTLGIFLFVLSLGVTYFAPRNWRLTQVMTNIVPFPAVIVDMRSMVSFRELTANLRSVKQFYESQDFSSVGMRIDFSTDDGKKRLKMREKEILNKMIEDQAIIALARKRGIFVSRDDAKQGVARKLDEYGNEERVRNDLKRLYGWSLTDFENKIVLPSLYQDQLNERFRKEVDVVSAAKTKIEQAASALRQGTDFDTVAKQYSDGQTAHVGGDIGWFALDDLAPELRSPVATQKVGIPGNVIESSIGFHIILIQETKQEEKNQLYHLRQIFARKNLFSDWLTEQMKNLPIWVLDPEYQWNSEKGRLEFRDPAWRQYESTLYQKSNGDASFLL